MKRFLCIILLLVSLFGYSQKWVTVTGGGANNGSSEANAWTFSQMISNLSQCKPCYVKAGNYGTGNYTSSASGTIGSPIEIIGYKNTPGDIVATNGSTFIYGVSSYSTNDYPTLQGTRTSYSGSGASVSGGSVSGVALNLSGAYVNISNFQFKDKSSAMYFNGTGSIANNLIIHDMGSYTGYSGNGIIMNGTGATFKNSYINNGGAQAFTNTSGDNQLIENNWISCDQSIGQEWSTDYYLLLTGYGGNGANYNIIRNNTIWRKPGQYHQGHGLILKGHAQNNSIENNLIQNCPLELSFDEVSNNTVTGGTIQGTGTESGNVDYAFILIANGAHHNTFQNMTVTGDVGVRFSDWNDGWTPSPDTDATDAGHDNYFKNIIFKNLHKGIQFAWHWYGTGTARDNIFDSCLFYGIEDELFTVERGNSGTILRNCIIANNSATTYEGGNNSLARPAGTNYPLNVTFINSTFYSNGFSTPSGTNNLTSNPLFTNAGAGDFTPQAGSPSIDSGSAATIATLDFNGDTRDGSPDRGPYEYNGGGADETPPYILTHDVLENTATTHRVDWTLNEGSKGQIIYDTNTGVVEGDYPYATTLENSFLTHHIQAMGNNPSGVNPYLTPSTTYYYRIKMEDASGNDALSSEYSFTTLSNGDVPVIALIGSSEVFLNVGETYTELGATWTDTEDGTGSATVGGDTVLDVVGTYVVTYNHTDTDSNQAVEVTRTVYVSAPSVEYFIPIRMRSDISSSRFFYINNLKKSF
ncbi:uncharacterized protein DUF5011 [Thalassospira sp. 11-3]|nr:uncharacterized protein DUF5011 [Thalassospira sp. 11-3]